MEKIYVKIDGIYCSHCEDVIKHALLKNDMIKQVTVKNNIAAVSYEGKLQSQELIRIITDLGYFTKEAYISGNRKDIREHIGTREFTVILCGILLCAYLIQRFLGFNIFNVIPAIDSSITYGMLVVTGVFTSIHCVSMCGAINLTAAVDRYQKKNIKKPLLYNVGRVLSYTLTGGIVGLIGSVININQTISGIFVILASLVMFLMALSMLGIIDFRLPGLSAVRNKSSNAFVIGILNGFMPCGPLQAMQLYALSTGNPFAGAMSMFLFGIGTVPLMLFMGMLVNFISGKRRILINKIASVLILILSVVMFNRGVLSLNVDLTRQTEEDGNYITAKMKDGCQVVEFDLSYDGYENVLVQKGIPVEMIIHVEEQYLTGCNNEIILRDFDITRKLDAGENIIEFTPEETGTFTYTCWMNMLKNYIKVVEDN